MYSQKIHYVLERNQKKEMPIFFCSHLNYRAQLLQDLCQYLVLLDY